MNLKEFLKTHKMSQLTLASLVGVDRSTVQRWVRGMSPRLEHAAKIVQCSGGQVSFQDLMGGSIDRGNQAENHQLVGRGTVAE